MTPIDKTYNEFRKHILDFKKLGSFSIKRWPTLLTKAEFVKKYSLKEFTEIHGIYIICAHGSIPWDDRPIVFYVGQTLKSIITRVSRHLRSLYDPSMGGEATGKSFVTMGIKLTQTFDVYFIESEILGINNSESSIIAEKAYQHIFDSIVKDMRCKIKQK